MARRVFGKLAFFTLQDNTGVIQLYIDKGRLEEEFNVRGACANNKGRWFTIRVLTYRTQRPDLYTYRN